MKPARYAIALLLAAITITTMAQTTHTTDQQKKHQMKNSTTNKEIIKQLMDQVLNQRRFELLNVIISPEYTGLNGLKGPKGFEAPVKQLLTSFPDLQWNLVELIAEGNTVLARWTINAKHQFDFNNIPATGKQVISGGMATYELSDGKIISSYVITDRVDFLQQLNVLPADLLSLQRKANPKKVIFIDKFTVPVSAVKEFKERVRVNRSLIKTLPGFIDDAAYESAEKDGIIQFVTLAEWESEEAIKKAKEVVQAAYKKEGFDIQEMLKRLNITIDREIYQPVANH